jgi:4-amino-4-deoxy-L-arabinose transferase-like glycosyltransferase
MTAPPRTAAPAHRAAAQPDLAPGYLDMSDQDTATRDPRRAWPRAGSGWPRRPAVGLAVLLTGTAVLYLWNLGASGYANSYYAAAVQAGSQSWKAWFFGALDPGSVITVDKPPASLWVMGLSARIFGFSSWSMLVPQALAGVAAVGLLYGAVRRVSGHGAGLLAGAMLALTPVAALMFRFNNPDALLTLLLVAGAYCVVRALERASTRWLLLAGTAIGFAFLTKMLQGFLVLPAFALVYLVAAPATLRTRIGQMLAAGAAVVVSAGWYVAVVQFWPASSRPYIGGSTTNSFLELALGYNGLSRLTGGAGSPGGGGGGAGGGNTGFGGSTGLLRMFGTSFGGEISWLLPAALVALVAGLWFRRSAPRTDPTRAAMLLWGGWLVVTALVFSYMSGTVHPYYAVALAPAIAALVAIAARELWRGRAHLPARIALALMVAVTGVWDYVLLAREAGSWQPWLRYGLLALTAVAVLGLLADLTRITRLGTVVMISGLLAGLGASSAWALGTAANPHSGSIPTSGPVSTSAMGGGGAGGVGGGGVGGRTTGGTTPGGAGATIGGTGGPDDQGSANSALITLLRGSGTEWAAAADGAQTAAGLQLSSGQAVISIGGFTGSDDAPTLAQFQQWVGQGRIHYFVSGGMGGGRGGGGSGSASQISTWVAAHYTATTVGGSTVYDLTAAAS